MKLLNPKSGVTLLEVLIYAGIAIIVLVISAESFNMIAVTQKKVDARREISQNLSFGLEKIEQSVKDGSAITFPAMKESSDTLSLTISGATTTYSLSNGVLQKTAGGTTTDITTDKVTVSGDIVGELFYRQAIPLIQVKMKVTSVSDSGIYSQAQTSFNVRE